jgi:hypothetical protein
MRGGQPTLAKRFGRPAMAQAARQDEPSYGLSHAGRNTGFATLSLPDNERRLNAHRLERRLHDVDS